MQITKLLCHGLSDLWAISNHLQLRCDFGSIFLSRGSSLLYLCCCFSRTVVDFVGCFINLFRLSQQSLPEAGMGIYNPFDEEHVKRVSLNLF